MAAESKSTWGCLAIFGLIWLSGVAAFDCLTFPGLVRQWRASWQYSSTQGIVLESRVIEEKGDESTSYRPHIRYQYQVGETSLSGERYRFGMNTPGHKLAFRTVHDHPPGSPIEVWYSPEDPGVAVLDRELSGQDLFIPMFLTPFNVVGLGFLLGPWLAARKGPGGVPVVREGLGWRARLSYGHPLSAAIASLGGLSFLAIFVVGLSTGMNPGAEVMRLTWTAVLGLSGYIGLRTVQHNQLGKTDLRIEPGRVEFTPAGAFGQRQSVATSEIEGLEIVTHERCDSEGTVTHTFELQLKLISGESHGLRQWNSRGQAQEFASWLQVVAGLKVS